MAQFHIGQRVKHIYQGHQWLPYGAEGCIESIANVPELGIEYRWMVRFDKHPAPSPNFNGCFACTSSVLVPITDPRASEFIADMQRFAHVAKTTKVTA